MLDPFFSAPEIFVTKGKVLSDFLNLQSLPFHLHEIIVAFCFYTFIDTYGSHIISSQLFPNIYPSLAPRSKVNWNIHVVSFVQSTLICTLALWVQWTDEERWNMDWTGRIWGYTGAQALVQAFAMGYFLWDLMASVVHLDVLGLSSLIHAVCAFLVVGIGFRPFANYYGLNFVLYELSTPFLNIHWFFDKLNMTGSRAQLYNGIVLIFTFFSCRLAWGVYQSARLYQDIWKVYHAPNTGISIPEFAVPGDPEWELFRSSVSSEDLALPMWLALGYLGTNTMLTLLNFYWFKQMISAVSKRFSTKEKISKADKSK
ncbi:hypothetical protein SS1G_00810 [Sclerotinia sclerotiorum 1980 UF-70]|uniref:TLC domain-containing protein n=2 Tax=Sclerotinia sclerotiorum (strain ATCC 18683 / 1980 / Ss-1) TaxID=665079 RepID=A7E685_SCLS1|nr:hypothetical protein SS1G_00810 [Sclerotinia sclerotiorum 1980 UF-70]APA07658.1 hypothetical protein sscle_03g024280 [Sclerotinia sclerotiorum 1980 UF-70]EDN91407.1 hypothetical protein SS1G_00810 [Sclerotinia sclerotiorum 1980 UF-70]